MNYIEFAKEFRKLIEANLKATRKLIREDELTPEELIELKDIYPTWETGLSVKVGELYQYNEKLYKVVQAHTTQADWTPDKTPALFNEVMPPSVIPQWKQPAGGHDAYKIGDKVLYKGIVWTSKINGNTTVPDGDEPYNRYWGK